MVPGAYFAVDVFFFIAGFLAAVIMLKKFAEMAEKKKKVNYGLYPALILHRIIRIWPTYFVCLMIYWKISIFLGDVNKLNIFQGTNVVRLLKQSSYL